MILHFMCLCVCVIEILSPEIIPNQNSNRKNIYYTKPIKKSITSNFNRTKIYN